MKKRKFGDGGALEDLAEGSSKGRFDEDVYKRARAFLERGGKQEEAAEEKRTVRSVRPKVTDTGDETARMAKRAPAPIGPAEIPVDPGVRAPAKEGRIPGEFERNVSNTMNALTPLGVGAAMRGAKGLGEAASKGWQAGRAEVQAAKELAESTARGAASRAAIQAKRAERAKQAAEARKTAEAMEEAKPVLKARPGKAKPTEKTRYRDEENVPEFEFKKGGCTKKYAEGGDVDQEVVEYRKSPKYTGYEDYTPSGRAAMRTYNEEEKGAKDIVRRKGQQPISPSAAKKAQATQRETASEIKRETRGMVPEGRYAKGGRIDGCATKGKTRGTMR